ncbi:MAG TPA: hypothetical protein VFP19_02305 [Candidatus Limnocylindrales bacterium]|nr:hypothetical protein [Candidatus Limnocylindrales bacterium]
MASPSLPGPHLADYALLDAGDGRRLERFGVLVVDRPAPGAVGPRRDPGLWRDADLRFDSDSGWSGASPRDAWTVVLEGLVLELRPTASGGLGLYPEHLANLEWLETRIRDRLDTGREAGGGHAPLMLNLFAHTGLATLAGARAGAAVTHVDAARSAVAWARRNAELNAGTDWHIRWLVDDAASFVAREERRGRRYDLIVLDPPSLGRSGRRTWRLSDDLPGLLAACAAISAGDTELLLTAHTTGLRGADLRALVAGAFTLRGPRGVAVEPLSLHASSGATLTSGWVVRLEGLSPDRGRRR